MKTIFWILLFSMIFNGCTSTHTIRYEKLAYEILNEKLKEEKAEITFINNKVVDGEKIKIGLDSVSWVEPEVHRSGMKTYNNSVALTSEVVKIDVTNRGQGVLDGIKYGFLVGAAVGALAAIPLSQEQKLNGSEKFGVGALLLIPICGLGGVIYGIPVGFIIGATDEYKLTLMPADSTFNVGEKKN
jgi:hypothetical protein